MRKIGFLLIFSVFIFYSLLAQTVLHSGDLAIIGLDTEDEDFAFVVFVDLDAGTEIYFTDEEADDDYTIGAGEGTVLYTAPTGGITAGTVITYIGNTIDFTITSDLEIGLGNDGDGLLAYQGTDVGTVTTFLHAVGEDSGDMGIFPDGFSNFIVYGADDGQYNGIRTETAVELMIAVNNSFNWLTSGSGITPFNTTSFTINAAAEPDPEPENHVIDFTASENGINAILLNWSDAVDASGYLIKLNTENLFVEPTDDNPVDDSSTEKNIPQGEETYNWTGLNAGTQYFFKIWAYSNSGVNIDYKTDGEVPVSYATTQSISTDGIMILSELCDPNDNYQFNRFIEITNIGTLSQDISGWSVIAVGNDSEIFTWNLSGSISPGESLVCGDDEATDFTADFIGSDWSGSNSSWNGGGGVGGGDGAKLINNSRTVIDQIISASSLFENKTIVRNADVASPTGNSNESEWTSTAVVNASDATPGTHVTNNPLAVSLSSFTAVYSSSQAILQWITQSEMNNAGWNIFRAEDNDFGSSMIINPVIIPGQGTTSISTSYSFEDEYEVEAGSSYFYWLESISYSGDVDQYGPVMLKIPVDGEEESPDVPDQYGLLSNYPNPFNSSTVIRYNLPVNADVILTIYNIKGEKIKVLDEGNKPAGYYQVIWDGKNSKNEQVSSGVYFYELVTPNFVKSRSMLLIK